MKTLAQKLADALEMQGWEVESIHTRDLEWWADEIWALKSRWAPHGAAAFITLLVDAQHEGLRNQGQAVWGVGCSPAFPTSRRDAEAGGTLSMRDVSKRNVDSFLEQLSQIRRLSINRTQ